MAFPPRTWAALDIPTAAQFNSEFRDNLNLLTPITSTITTTGTQTALALPSGRNNLIIFANNATLLTLQGITAGYDGQMLTIYSIGAGQVDLANQNGSASAALRIINGVTGTISLAAGSGRVTLVYDTTTARWRVRHHEQGAWITPTFAAGNFTAGGAQTWTVGAGDVQTYAYRLAGRTMTLAWYLITTTVGGTPDVTLLLKIPGGFTASKSVWVLSRVSDNGAAAATGLAVAAPTTTNISLYVSLSLTGNWTAATDTTQVNGSITFEVD